MPGYTSQHRIPYPLASERLADYPNAARQAAEKLDSAIGKTTEWQNITLGSGWRAASNQTPRARFVSGLLQVDGVVVRGVGGYVDKIVQLPAHMRPSKTMFIAATIANRNGTLTGCHLYLEPTGWVSVDKYQGLGGNVDWIVPISFITAL